MLQPNIQKPQKNSDYNHDKLDVTDIKGTNPDLYKKYKNLEGRNYMDMSDIDKNKPTQLKQNKITNIPDYKAFAQDINAPLHPKFVSNRETNPLDPAYQNQ